MKKLLALALALAGVCGAVSAQTPATNPMPDGSHDMYIGLGVVSEPVYDGARERRERALPVLQLEWSNGMFVSGLSAGMHLSGQPSMEFGPLLGLQRARSASGNSGGLGGLGTTASGADLLPPLDKDAPGGDSAGQKDQPAMAGRLAGMKDIGARLEAGGFFNYYLTPRLRLTNNLLYGSGRERKGARWTLGLQHLAAPISAHHSVSLAAGFTLVNRHYNASYFGVLPEEAARGINREYAPGGGLKEVRLGARWNWALKPAWMLTSGFELTRLQGDAKDSPLARRPTNLTLSTALAYRF